MKNQSVKYKEFNLKTLTKKLVIPAWQRWKDEKNVENLKNAVAIYGQLRPLLIAELPDGTLVLSDGNHLITAAVELGMKTISAFVVDVDSEESAHKMFNSFNTTGRSLSVLDHIVGIAATGNEDYRRFMTEVLSNPKSTKEAKNIYKGDLFTLPSLYSIFFAGTGTKALKKGSARLAKNFERRLDLVRFLDARYTKNPSIIAHRAKNGRSMKLNGGSIIEVFDALSARGYLNGNHSNEDILKMLVDFTLWFHNTMDGVQYNKDNMSKFRVYLEEVYDKSNKG